MRRAGWVSWGQAVPLPLLLVLGVAACGRHEHAAAPAATAAEADADTAADAGADQPAPASQPAPAADGSTVASPDGASLNGATPNVAAPPVAVDLPPDFPRAFPLPPGGIVTQATATRDEGSVQADAEVAAQQDPGALFAWYEQTLGHQGWNIESRSVTAEKRGEVQGLRASKGDSTAEVAVGPLPRRAGWCSVTLSVYWSESKGG